MWQRIARIRKGTTRRKKAKRESWEWMAQSFMVFGRNYFRNFPGDTSQERNTGTSSASLLGKKKKD